MFLEINFAVARVLGDNFCFLGGVTLGSGLRRTPDGGPVPLSEASNTVSKVLLH